MKFLPDFLIIATIAGGLTACGGTKTEAGYDVIPLPREVSATAKSSFRLTDKVRIVYPAGNEAMRRNADHLAAYMQRAAGLTLRTAPGGRSRGNIVLREAPAAGQPEGYTLQVNRDSVVLSGTGAGVFHGLQTLRKAVAKGPGGAARRLPGVTINDAPRFAYRGVHLDVSRHFFTVDEVKSFIDMMALHNMNRLHWHLTDDQGWRIEIKKYPALTQVGARRKETVIGHNSGRYDGQPYGGYFTQEQAREVVRYAKERHITVVPEIDLPGHMQAALAAYPHLGCTGGPYEVWTKWGVSDNVLCAGNDSVLTFIDDVLREITGIFPSEYIHIGGDECPKTQWKQCPRCQARIQALGLKSDNRHSKEEYLQSYIIRHGGQTLSALGRKMIGWDETLEGGLAPGATVMSWRGEAGGIEAARQGHDVIMTPNSYLYFDYYQSDDRTHEPLAIGGYVPLERVYSYQPLPASLPPGEQARIIGVQANHWTEYIPSLQHLQYMALPRWAALAEVQWSPAEARNYDRFLARLPQLTALYDAEGYNYARHAFGVKAGYRALPDGTVEARLTTIDGAPVHYTLDGTVPTAAAPRADSVLRIAASCTLRAAAVRGDGQESRVLAEPIVLSKATGRPVKANRPVSRQYEFGGVAMLTDGLKGTPSYKTGRWIGFYADDLDVTIDLQELTEVTRVGLNTCVEKGDWIFDIRGLAVEVSADGEHFTRVFDEQFAPMTAADRNGIRTHTAAFSAVKARYVRVVAPTERSIPAWHGGKGRPGFAFVDEITVD